MDRKESALYTNKYNLKKKKKTYSGYCIPLIPNSACRKAPRIRPLTRLIFAPRYSGTPCFVFLLDLGPPIRTSVQNDRAENTPLGKNPERDRASRPTRDDVKTVYVGTPHARLSEYYTIPDIRDARTDR